MVFAVCMNPLSQDRVTHGFQFCFIFPVLLLTPTELGYFPPRVVPPVSVKITGGARGRGGDFRAFSAPLFSIHPQVSQILSQPMKSSD